MAKSCIQGEQIGLSAVSAVIFVERLFQNLEIFFWNKKSTTVQAYRTKISSRLIYMEHEIVVKQNVFTSRNFRLGSELQ